MDFFVRPGLRAGRDVQLVALDLLDRALARLDQLDGGATTEAEEQVHEIRKRCKEARGLARLVRPTLGKGFGEFDGRVRDAARELSSVRDAHAVLASLDQLRASRFADGASAFLLVRAGHAAAATEASEGFEPGDSRVVTARRLLTEARRDVKGWNLPNGFDAFERGLRDSYRSGRRSFRGLGETPDDAQIHECRKRVKQLWYQVRLLEPSAPSVLRSLAGSLDGMAEALGDDHDLAVLIELVAADPDRFGGIAAVAEVTHAARARQHDLRRGALRRASSVYAEPPRAFVARVATYWHITLDHGPELDFGGLGTLPTDPERSPDESRGDATGATSTA